jgi:large subunit ribosomal protein L9
MIITVNVARSPEEAERQARGERATVEEEDAQVLEALQAEAAAEDAQQA